VLQRLEGLSDWEAVDRYTFDVPWRYAAGVGGYRAGGRARFAHTVLVDMRERLRRSKRPNRIFEAGLITHWVSSGSRGCCRVYSRGTAGPSGQLLARAVQHDAAWLTVEEAVPTLLFRFDVLGGRAAHAGPRARRR
jgi:hypothetical protein